MTFEEFNDYTNEVIKENDGDVKDLLHIIEYIIPATSEHVILAAVEQYRKDKQIERSTSNKEVLHKDHL